MVSCVCFCSLMVLFFTVGNDCDDEVYAAQVTSWCHRSRRHFLKHPTVPTHTQAQTGGMPATLSAGRSETQSPYAHRSHRMFGDMQMSALADMIQAALMLAYNKRKVGRTRFEPAPGPPVAYH